MESTRKDEAVIEEAVPAFDQELVQLDEVQLIAVGGGIADITFS
jgi:hypothetical protein